MGKLRGLPPLQGPADHTLAQIKEAIRDGLRAVKNTLDDSAVVPGAGAFEVAAAHHLRTNTKRVRPACVEKRNESESVGRPLHGDWSGRFRRTMCWSGCCAC